MNRAKSIIAGVLLAGAIAPAPVQACIEGAPFEITDIRQADVVFTGKPVAFERVSPGESDSLSDYGLLTVRVENVLKGEASGDVELYWWNSTFGVPETLETFDRVLIAAVRSDSRGLPLRGPSATVFPTRRPDLLQVLQAPCSSPFILPASSGNDVLFANVLRGEPFDEAAYFAAESRLEYGPIPKKAGWWEQNAFPAGVLAIAVLFAAWLQMRAKRSAAA